MRLLTHNTLRNNTAEAKGGGFPLKITATEIRVDDGSDVGEDGEKQVKFVKSVLGILDWPALAKAAKDMGFYTLPPSLTNDLAEDESFLKALYHVLMNIHLVKGVLTCPTTGKEFPVSNGIPNFMLEEEECEHIRA